MRVVDTGIDDADLDALPGVAGAVHVARTYVLDTPGSVELRVGEGVDRRIGLNALDAGVARELLELAGGDSGGLRVDEAVVMSDMAASILDGLSRAQALRAAEIDDDVYQSAP